MVTSPYEKKKSRLNEKPKTNKYITLYKQWLFVLISADLADMLEKMDRDGLIRPEKANVTFDDVIGVSFLSDNNNMYRI